MRADRQTNIQTYSSQYFAPLTGGRSNQNKKHLKNVGPIRHCEPPRAACSNSVATPGEWQCKIDVHNDKDNAWQRGPLWPHRMGPNSLYSLFGKCTERTKWCLDSLKMSRTQCRVGLCSRYHVCYYCARFSAALWRLSRIRQDYRMVQKFHASLHYIHYIEII